MNEQNSKNQDPSTSLQPNVAAALSYIAGLITGIIFFMISKDKFVRFHAMQSIILSLAVMVISVVLGMIPFVNILSPFIGLGAVILFVVLMIKAYQGEKFMVPYIGAYAEKYS